MTTDSSGTTDSSTTDSSGTTDSFGTTDSSGTIEFKKPMRFSLEELQLSTLNFTTRIRPYRNGQVYGGRLSNGLRVAVKVLGNDSVVEEALFIAEVEIICNTDHPNLVKLYGYCFEAETKALVYELMYDSMENDSTLGKSLYRYGHITPWGELYDIGIQTAKALAYLHDDKQIIHGDFKTDNVFYDDGCCTKITKFGLANLIVKDQTQPTTTPMNGTRGFAAPEVWGPFSHVTFKSDVYSFGMLLFEILKRGWNELKSNWFPKFVWEKFESGKLDEILLDRRISEIFRKQATILTMVALWCAQSTPEARPSMSTVALVLEREVMVNLPPNPFLPNFPTFKMQPQWNHPEVQSFRVDVLESLDQQEVRRGGSQSISSVEILLHKLSLEKQIRYSYSELRTISGEFKVKLGSGAYGEVFKGQDSNGVEVAVKILKAKDNIKQTFLAEVSTMGNTKHQNLIKLLGFCLERDHLALVYEYMEMGSLETILYNKTLRIEWEILYDIAIGTAMALSHLHHDCTPPIIHFDVKPSNVLLGLDHSPKLTDFGLATLNDKGATHFTMTHAKGTVGFGAPEVWVPFAHVTSKCDVYSFGMLLFEILGTARNDQTTEWFPEYVWEKFKGGKLNDVMEERGIKNKDREKAILLAMVALWCIQHTPETRPTMIAVVEVLVKQIPVNEPPNPFLTSHSVLTMQQVLNYI